MHTFLCMYLSLYIYISIDHRVEYLCAADCPLSFLAKASAMGVVVNCLTVVLVLVSCAEVGLVAAAKHSVVQYGAKGDGRTDDSKAFLAAWRAVCGDRVAPALIIPWGRTFLLGPVRFSGPCKSNNIHVQIKGNLLRPNVLWGSQVESWILFHNIQGLVIYGGGQIDGQGSAYWNCKTRRRCFVAPNALALLNCDNSKVMGLKLKNSPQMHVILGFSKGVQISGLDIQAPWNSPNTDGVHVEHCQHVDVSNSNIAAGDDCISIGTGTFDVNVTQIRCGPGHGISIGSLGAQNSWATAQQIRVANSHIFDTTYGVRIKTWQGGSGSARGISFEHVNFTAVQNPIFLDQYYCPFQHCANKTSAVQVSDVKYIGLQGTTTSKVAISLLCSHSKACTGIVMQHINIRPARRGQLESHCENAKGAKIKPVIPDVPCLR